MPTAKVHHYPRDWAGQMSRLQGRTGRIEVVYVAHLSSLVMLSAGAIAEME